MNVQSPDSPQKAAVTATAQPLQLRSRSFTAVVLRLAGAGERAFLEALEALMRQAPHFFLNAPLVLDLEQAGAIETKADFVKLVRALRARKIIARSASRTAAGAGGRGLRRRADHAARRQGCAPRACGPGADRRRRIRQSPGLPTP